MGGSKPWPPIYPDSVTSFTSTDKHVHVHRLSYNTPCLHVHMLRRKYNLLAILRTILIPTACLFSFCSYSCLYIKCICRSIYISECTTMFSSTFHYRSGAGLFSPRLFSPLDLHAYCIAHAYIFENVYYCVQIKIIIYCLLDEMKWSSLLVGPKKVI